MDTWLCECGWSGQKSELLNTSSDPRVCPGCGSSTGLKPEQGLVFEFAKIDCRDYDPIMFGVKNVGRRPHSLANLRVFYEAQCEYLEKLAKLQAEVREKYMQKFGPEPDKCEYTINVVDQVWNEVTEATLVDVDWASMVSIR